MEPFPLKLTCCKPQGEDHLALLGSNSGWEAERMNSGGISVLDFLCGVSLRYSASTETHRKALPLLPLRLVKWKFLLPWLPFEIHGNDHSFSQGSLPKFSILMKLKGRKCFTGAVQSIAAANSIHFQSKLDSHHRVSFLCI